MSIAYTAITNEIFIICRFRERIYFCLLLFKLILILNADRVSTYFIKV